MTSGLCRNPGVMLPELGRSLRCNAIFMGWVDNPVCRTCHEISGVIAVQHRQDNFGCALFRTLLVAVAFFTADPAIAAATKPDPILHDTPLPACQAQADYAPGVDADGEAVAPADVDAAKVPVPPQVVIPLHRRGAYAVLDGTKLEPLVNPAPCKN